MRTTTPLTRRHSVLRRLRRAAYVLLACAALCACGDGGGTASGPGGNGDPEPPTPPSGNPVADAYAALVRADVDALPAVIAALDDAVARDPQDGVSAFYAGTMRLWRLTQLRGAPQPDLVEMAHEAQAMLEHLETARALRPQSEHAAAFLGVAQVTVGSYVGDESRVEYGRAVLADAVPLHPVYVNGVRAITLGALPRSHPAFADAVAAMEATIEGCGLVASGEDGLGFVHPEGTQPSARRMCNNLGVVAHVWEGILLTFGDIAVKQGDARRARALYASARSAPNSDTWTLRELLDERIAQADARAALYLDDDPSNDPKTWMEGDKICTGCHASER
ncbi:MAG TPA: hypothetical protein VIS07_22745 [Candidatus Binatia bacterium]